MRARHGIVPTERALEIAPDVAEGLDRLRHVFRERAVFDPASSTREFRAVASGYFECLIVPELVHRARARAPSISVSVAPLGPDVDVRALADGGSDLALGRFAEPLEGFVVEQVLEDGLCCLVRADAVGEAPTLSREAFETLPHVVVAPPGRWRTGVFRTLEEAGLRRRVALTVSHFLAAPPAVKRTGAVATLPRRLAEPFGNDPELRVLAPPVDLGTFPHADGLAPATSPGRRPRVVARAGARSVRDSPGRAARQVASAGPARAKRMSTCGMPSSRVLVRVADEAERRVQRLGGQLRAEHDVRDRDTVRPGRRASGA